MSTPAPDGPSADWKVEAVRQTSKMPLEFLKLVLNMAFAAVVSWYAFGQIKSHVDTFKDGQVEIKKTNDETIKSVTETHAKTLLEVKQGFKEASDRQDRLYERLIDRRTIGIGVGAAPTNNPPQN